MSISGSYNEAKAEELGTCVLYYYPNRTGGEYFPSQANKLENIPPNPFGHLALGDFKDSQGNFLRLNPRDILEQPEYLSFRNGKDAICKTNDTNHANELKIYDNYCVKIQLPMVSLKKLREAMKTFNELDMRQYNIANNNCATNVRDFLQTIGVLPKNEIFLDPRPQYIAQRAWSSKIKEMATERQALLLANDLTPLQKIEKLLEHDIERLKLSMQHCEIMKENEKKPPKEIARARLMQLLTHIKEIIEVEKKASASSSSQQSSSVDYDNLVSRMLTIKSKLTGDTLNNFKECLVIIPSNKIKSLNAYPDLQVIKSQQDQIEEKQQGKKQIKLYKVRLEEIAVAQKELKQSLADSDCANPKEALRKLLELNIERLQLRILQETSSSTSRNSLSGNVNIEPPKIVNKKTVKKEDKMSRLIDIKTQLETKPVNYEEALTNLKRYLKDFPPSKLSGKNDTHDIVQCCLNFFPYDQMPSIELKKTFLINLSRDLTNMLSDKDPAVAALRDTFIKNIFPTKLKTIQKDIKDSAFEDLPAIAAKLAVLSEISLTDKSDKEIHEIFATVHAQISATTNKLTNLSEPTEQDDKALKCFVAWNNKAFETTNYHEPYQNSRSSAGSKSSSFEKEIRNDANENSNVAEENTSIYNQPHL